VLELQRGLFAAAAEVAAHPRARDRLVPGISSVTPEMTAALEQMIDALLADYPLRPAFVVSGASPPRRRWIWGGRSCAAPSDG
jgi:cob(I)alamin adenosyltransferase